MPLYKAEGIVIKKHDCGESGEIVTLLTRESQIVRMIAKGIKSLKGSMAGKLELLSTVRVLLASGRNLETCLQAEVLSSRKTIREDLVRVAYGLYYLELFETALHCSDFHEKCFALLDEALGLLERRESRLELLSITVIYRLLTLIGYSPQVTQCVKCSCTGPFRAFSALEGGMICADCRQNTAAPLCCSEKVSTLLGNLPGFSLRAALEGAVPEDLSFQARELLEEHIRCHLSRKLKAAAFISTIRTLGRNTRVKEKQNEENNGT